MKDINGANREFRHHPLITTEKINNNQIKSIKFEIINHSLRFWTFIEKKIDEKLAIINHLTDHLFIYPPITKRKIKNNQINYQSNLR